MSVVPKPDRTSVVVFLSVVVLVMVCFSVIMPWYRVDLDLRTDLEAGVSTSALEVHMTYLRIDEPGIADIGIPYSYADVLQADLTGESWGIADVIEIMMALLVVWVILGVLFVGQCLTGRGGLVAGWATVFLGVLSVTYLAMSLPDALSGTESWLGTSSFPPEGFTGTTWMLGIDAPPWREDWSWGPSAGWYLAVSACSIQAGTVFYRTVTVLRSIGEGKGWIGAI